MSNTRRKVSAISLIFSLNGLYGSKQKFKKEVVWLIDSEIKSAYFRLFVFVARARLANPGSNSSKIKVICYGVKVHISNKGLIKFFKRVLKSITQLSYSKFFSKERLISLKKVLSASSDCISCTA